MLRPQVFALQEGDATIGLVASEKQAIDATLHSLAKEDCRFRPIADRYWNARGGSHTDGGAFTFTVSRNNGTSTVSCRDKFGRVITCPTGEWTFVPSYNCGILNETTKFAEDIVQVLKSHSHLESFSLVSHLIPSWDINHMKYFIQQIKESYSSDSRRFDWKMGLLSLLNDRRYDCGNMKRSVVLQTVREAIDSVLDSVPQVTNICSSHVRRVDWQTRKKLRCGKRRSYSCNLRT